MPADCADSERDVFSLFFSLPDSTTADSEPLHRQGNTPLLAEGKTYELVGGNIITVGSLHIRCRAPDKVPTRTRPTSFSRATSSLSVHCMPLLCTQYLPARTRSTRGLQSRRLNHDLSDMFRCVVRHCAFVCTRRGGSTFEQHGNARCGRGASTERASAGKCSFVSRIGKCSHELQRHLTKVSQHVHLLRSRMASWSASDVGSGSAREVAQRE